LQYAAIKKARPKGKITKANQATLTIPVSIRAVCLTLPEAQTKEYTQA